MSDRFRDSGNRTITDTATGLTWTLDSYGRDSEGQLEAGASQGFSWNEAVERFGRGRKYRGWGFEPSDGGPERIKADTYAKYVFGSEVVAIGDYEDWRLPTVEEFWSLIEEVKDQHTLNPNAIIASPKLMPKLETFWTANKFGFLNQFDCAWLFYAWSDGCRMQCDAPPSGTAPVVFVREGTMFHATIFPESAYRRRTRVPLWKILLGK